MSGNETLKKFLWRPEVRMSLRRRRPFPSAATRSATRRLATEFVAAAAKSAQPPFAFVPLPASAAMSKGNRRKVLDKEAAPSASRPNPSTVSLRVETREDSPSSASASAPASTTATATATATTLGTCNKSNTALKDISAGRKRPTVDYLGKALLDILPEIPEESGAKSKVKPKVVKQAVVVAPVHEWRRPAPRTQSEHRLSESSHEFARRSRDQDTNDTPVGDLSRPNYGGSEDLADRMRKASLPLPPRTFYVPGADSSASLTRVLQRAQGPRNNALFPMFPGRRCIAAGRGTRVELHAHLEGSVRYETIWELMKSKKLSLPGDGSIRAVKDALIVREPMSLLQFLEPVPTYLQAIAGDLVALERIAYEFCEDKVEQGVLYVEAHYAPQMLTSHRHPRGRTLQELADVVMAINRGFRFAEVEMGIIVRTILAIIVGMGDCNDILHLVNQFRDQGIVGIDLHSSYEEFNKTDVFSPTYEEVPLTREEVRAFTVATSMGIHRTVHAGLMGSAYMVQRGIEKYRAQRIGHGYEVLKLPQLYIKCLERGVHFECCPWMSLLTCSVDGAKKHPVAQFAEDGANFSLSTSYPTITGLTLQEEYDLVTSWGLTEAHLVRSNINALRSSFLQPAEKGQLMQTLLENIGIKRRNAEK